MMEILASDFDGTLYFDGIGIKTEDRKAIHQFMKAGNIFGFCTGRPIKGIDHFIGDIKPDFYILNNGSYILDKEHHCLFSKTISYATCISIARKYSQYDMTIFTDKHIYFTNENFKIKDQTFKSYQELLSDSHISIYGISIYLNNEIEAQNLMKEMESFEDIDIYQNINNIDCVANGCSKNTGIQFIKKYYCFNEEIACIGDSYNDLSMLANTSKSFTFNQSPEDIKKYCRYLVDSVEECISILITEK